MIVIFLIYFIPGLPKEGLGYAVGLSKIKLIPFLFLVVVGRTPALMISIVIGHMYDIENYTNIIIISAIAVVFCVLAFIYRKKIMKKLDSEYERYSDN